MNRYKENFQYLVNHLNSYIQSVQQSGKDALKESLNTLFGFKKTFLLLSDVGRLVAVSSHDGKV